MFTLGGFPLTALAFRIMRKTIRLHCSEIRVTKNKSTLSQGSLAVMPTCCEADREGVQLGRRVQGNQVKGKLGWNSPPFCFFIIQKNTSRARSLPAMTHVRYIKRPPTKRVGREGGVGIATTWKKNNHRAAEALGSCGCHGFGVQEQSLGWDQHLPAAPGAWAWGQNSFSPVPPVHCRLGREHLLHKQFLGFSLLVLCFVLFSFKKKKIEKLSYLNSYFKLSICLNGKSCKRGVSGQVRGLKSLNEPGGWWQQQGQAGTEAGAQAKQKWSWGEAVVLERGIQDK